MDNFTEKLALGEKVVTAVYCVLTAAWAITLLYAITALNKGADFGIAIVATFIIFLLTFPIWVFVLPALAAVIALTITPIIFRFRA